MTFDLDNLIPPHVVAAVRDQGLHKVAGAMLGVPELTLKEAVFSLGAKAYQRRKEARAVVDGIVSYAALANEKLADSTAIMGMLRRALVPAIAGAGIAAAPQLLSPTDPYQPPKSIVPSLATGAALGGGLSALSGLYHMPAGLSGHVADAMRPMHPPHIP